MKDTFKENISAALRNLKGSGKFISQHTADFVFPALKVNKVGEIAYPVNELQVKSLVKVAHPAPFGKGSKTIVDPEVRKVWEIDADQLSFHGKRWEGLLAKVMGVVKNDLGLEGYKISASLYKLLIYEKGGFFLTHKDSEKEKGMFGTLIIGLPSSFTGGELVVSFEGVQETADFASGAGDYKIPYAAFYADCDHEVKPVLSGNRVCLVYNLIQEKAARKIQMTSLKSRVDDLSRIFRKYKPRKEDKPHIVLLGHQYTPENFSRDALKLDDRPKAEVLLQAAKNANWRAKLCLATSYKSGMPDDDGEYFYDRDYENVDAAMVEVYDEELYIEHWAEDGLPALDKMSFDEDDLIALVSLDDGEPIVKESTGYMGNYGPDLMHWYHYGAVMVWPPDTNARLLLEQEGESILNWIDYLSKNIGIASAKELAAVEKILSEGIKAGRGGKVVSYNAIAGWVISLKGDTFFDTLTAGVRQSYFVGIDAASWLKLIDAFSPKFGQRVITQVTGDISMAVIGKVVSIVRLLAAAGKCKQLVSGQMKRLPGYFLELQQRHGKKDVTASVLRDLFWLESQIPQPKAWSHDIADVLTSDIEKKYVTDVIIPELFCLPERGALAQKMLTGCQRYFQKRADRQPHPPADWSRKVPSTSYDKKQWAQLKAFLESPDLQVFDYKNVLSERKDMEHAIRRADIDLRTETIRKGSPHTLRIIKTQAAYQKKMKTWKEDLVWLDKVTAVLGQ